MKSNYGNNRQIAAYIFSGSTTMVGVCITIIALFRVMKISLQTYADDMLSINSTIFIASAICAYAALRRENYRRMEWFADVLFFTGMIVMLLISFMIVYTTY